MPPLESDFNAMFFNIINNQQKDIHRKWKKSAREWLKLAERVSFWIFIKA